MAFPLTNEQLEIVNDRGGELLVSAAAGSGKTRVLVSRLLDRVINEKIDIDQFLIITFTKAAAAELRGRIAQELAASLAQDPNNRHLRRQTVLIYRTQISTIHAFCSAFLRENGHQLDLDPDFRLCEEGEAQILMEQTLDQLLDRSYEGLEPDSPFAQLVDAVAAERDDRRLAQIVLDIYGRIQSHPDPGLWLCQQKELWRLDDAADAAETIWGRRLLDDERRRVSHCRQQLERALKISQQDELLRVNYAPSLEQTLLTMNGFLAARKWDEAVVYLPFAFPAVGRKRKRTIELEPQEERWTEEQTERVKRIRDQVKKRLEKVAQRFEGNSADLIAEMKQMQPSVHALMDLVLEFQRAYEQEKRHRNLVDFSDLEHLTVRLLRNQDGQPTELASHWSKRYVEVMVDEYQDTNQVQNAIFSALSHEGRTLFQVGDVKQSIYRFRLADPTIFLAKYERFEERERANEGEPRKRILSCNFRSRPQVLLGCNDLFRAIMSREFGELDYSEDQALVPGASFPEAEDNELELNLLDLSCLADQEEEKESKDLLEARFVARKIRELLDRPFMVSQGDGLRPLRPSDVMILLRSPGPVLRYYVRAMEEEGVSWTADRSGDLFDTTEVNVALSILQVVDNPRQDVALIAALRSPVYGFTADQLALIRAGSDGDFYDALVFAADQGDEACSAFLAELEQLRFGAGDKTCRQLIWHIYETSNLMGIFGAMTNGKERQENLLGLYALAGDLEEKGCRTLFQFLIRLERMRKSGATLGLAAVNPEGDGVSILSIHRSKGLEKPVVFLCGLSRKLNTDDLKRPVLFHPELGIGPSGLDRQRMIEYPLLARKAVARQLESEMMAEELRLLYVAMTRAKEKLILTMGLTEGVRNLERLREDLGYPVSPEALAAQSSVGYWILLHALTRGEANWLRALAGLPEVGGGETGPAWAIHWVDGQELMERRRRLGHFVDLPETKVLPVEEIQRNLSWKYPYSRCVDLPSKLTATQLKGRMLDQEAAEGAAVSETSTASKAVLMRPNFIAQKHGLTAAQRGTAFHLALQHLVLDGNYSITAIEEQLDRLVKDAFLTPMQRDAVSVTQLAAFLNSAIGEEMTAAGNCFREYKFSLLVPAQEYIPDAQGEEILFQGVVDAWFETEDGITIIDFKSDVLEPDGEALRAREYRPQLEAYRRALSEVLGKPVVRCVIWFLKSAVAIEL